MKRYLQENYKVYFRIPFTIYFVAKRMDLKLLCLVKKKFNGNYFWKEV